MSKLLKHLGFGGKKSHKNNYNEHRTNSLSNENTNKNSVNQKNNISVTLSSTRQDTNNAIVKNEMLPSTRRLPVQHINHIPNESLHKKPVNTDSISKLEQGETNEYHNYDNEINDEQNSSRSSKNVKSRILKEQKPPPLAEYSDPFDIQSARKLAAEKVMKREDDYSYTLPYEMKKKETLNYSSVPQGDYDQPWDRISHSQQANVQNQCSSEAIQCPNYEEPWDLTTTQRRIAGDLFSSKPSSKTQEKSSQALRNECIKVVSNQRVQSSSTEKSNSTYESPWDFNAEQLDIRSKPQEFSDNKLDSYETPWDWRPERKDIRPKDDTYESPWDDNENKSKKSVPNQLKCDTRVLADGYDEPWDKRNNSTDIKLYKIDENLPLEKQSWYHGSISRLKAEQILLKCKEASFLVRQSESNKEHFSLSLKSMQSYMHMKIVNTDNRYILGQFSQPFLSVPSMISHYTLHKLPIKGAEHMSLVFAISTSM